MKKIEIKKSDISIFDSLGVSEEKSDQLNQYIITQLESKATPQDIITQLNEDDNISPQEFAIALIQMGVCIAIYYENSQFNE